MLIIKADFTPSFKVGNFNFLELNAAQECFTVDRSDGVGYIYRHQAGAGIECAAADRGDGIGYFNRCQAAAAIEAFLWYLS